MNDNPDPDFEPVRRWADPLTVIPDEPEPETLPRRRDFALILAAAAIIAIALLLGGTRV
jgi:hypothetical protein